SVNTYFAKLEEEVGLCETVEMAEKMGIKVPFKAADGSARPDNAVTPSFTLGTMDVSTLDMASAYATAASGGTYCKPAPIAEILDRSGQTIKKYKTECKRAMSKETAAKVNAILVGLQQPGGFGHSNGTGLPIP